MCIPYLFVLIFIDSASFEFKEYNVSEAEDRRYIKIVLEEPATSDRIIPVYTTNNSATGEVSIM